MWFWMDCDMLVWVFRVNLNAIEKHNCRWKVEGAHWNKKTWIHQSQPLQAYQRREIGKNWSQWAVACAGGETRFIEVILEILWMYIAVLDLINFLQPAFDTQFSLPWFLWIFSWRNHFFLCLLIMAKRSLRLICHLASLERATNC